MKHLKICIITYSTYSWKLIPFFSAIKHCTLGLKDAVPQHRGHYKRRHKLPPWRLERRHHCKCWQMLACVSCHTESVIHSVFQTIEPRIFQVHRSLVINNKMNAQQMKRDLNKHWSYITIDFKHFQSSTRGEPGSLIDLRMAEPLLCPNNSVPINSMLLSKWVLCLVVSLIWLRIWVFLSDPPSALLYCTTKAKLWNRRK